MTWLHFFVALAVGVVVYVCAAEALAAYITRRDEDGRV
jgi:hypothetical protein